MSWATSGRKPGISDSYYDYVKKYEDIKSTFNPVKFNPENWAEAAKIAGMKYGIHHQTSRCLQFV